MLKIASLALSIAALALGMEAARAQGQNPLYLKLQQDEAQYKHDLQNIQPIEDKIKALNQQIYTIEKPFQEKYQGLDEALQKLDKPYQDKINSLYEEMRRADAPYQEKIKERDEEQRRIDWTTRPLREQIRQLTDSSWEKKRALDEAARQLERDRAALQEYKNTHKENPQQSLPTNKQSKPSQKKAAP